MLKNRNVDFLFLVEHEDRELYSVHRIAEELKTSGASSLILSMEFYCSLIASLAVKVIVIPYAISSDTWPLKYILSICPEVQVVSLNWEQLLSEANKEFKKPRDNYIKELVYHLAWSLSYKAFLIDAGVKADNVSVIGNPLTQVLSEFVTVDKMSYAFLSEEFSFDKHRKTIFFPMNYGWAFYSDKAIEKKIEQGYDRITAYEYKEYSSRCLEQFCYFIRDVLSSNEFNIIIRPHPSISVEQYIDVFNKYAEGVVGKVCITKKYTIKEWIAVSDLVASSWSTSVWDAANVGKKVFLFTPFVRPPWLNTWWNDIVPNISSFSEISNVVSNVDEIASTPASLIIPEIATWLKNISDSTNSNFQKSRRKDVANLLKSYVSVYSVRCRFRLFSMRFLGGAFVKQGMKRDYFLPINVD